MSEQELPCALQDVGRWPVSDASPGGGPVEFANEYRPFRAALNVAPGVEPRWEDVVRYGALLLSCSSKALVIATEVCSALVISRSLSGLLTAVEIWLGLMTDEIWPHVLPKDPANRADQLRRFITRAHLTVKEPARQGQVFGSLEHKEMVVASLNRLESEAQRQLSGVACVSDIRTLRRAVMDLGGGMRIAHAQTSARGVGAQSLIHQIAGALAALEEEPKRPVSLDVAEPWLAALRAPVWQVLRAIGGQAPALPSPWRLARALAWGLEPTPSFGRGPIPVDVRFSADLNERLGRLPAVQGLPAPWMEVEQLWQERALLTWLDPHRVASDALRRAGHEGAALAVERAVASWISRAKGLVELRCDDESKTRLSDDMTRRWCAKLPLSNALVDPSGGAPVSIEIAQRDLTIATEQLTREVRGALAASQGTPQDGLREAIRNLEGPMDQWLALVRACDPWGPCAFAVTLPWLHLKALIKPTATGLVSLTTLTRPNASDEPPWVFDDDSAASDDAIDALWAFILNHPLWLDAYRAFSRMLSGRGVMGSCIVMEEIVAELVIALPDLPTLRLDDGRALANDKTREWLNEIVSRARAAPSSPSKTPDSEVASSSITGSSAQIAAPQRVQPSERVTEDPSSIGDEWASGLSMIKAGQLQEGLACLEVETRLCIAGRDRFLGELQLADALLELDKPMLAALVLEELEARAIRFHLDAWEPKLAARLARARLLTMMRGAEDGVSRLAPEHASILRRALSIGLYGMLTPEP